MKHIFIFKHEKFEYQKCIKFIYHATHLHAISQWETLLNLYKNEFIIVPIKSIVYHIQVRIY